MIEPLQLKPVRLRGWLVPALAGVLQLVTGLVILAVGIRYDDRREDPGAVTWLAVSILASPWLIYARASWRREKTWTEQQQLPEHRVAALLGPIIQRHGITSAITAIEQLAGTNEQRVLQEGRDVERR